MEDMISQIEKDRESLEKLIIQRDNCGSMHLKYLLNEEIAAYENLLNTFAQYLEVSNKNLKREQELSREYIESSCEIIKQISNPQMALANLKNVEAIVLMGHKTIEAKMFVLEFNQYLFSILSNRDFKNLQSNLRVIVSFITTNLIDVVGNLFPGIGFFKQLHDKLDELNDLCNDLDDKSSDYSTEDFRLKQIEIRIQIYNEAAKYYEENIKKEEETSYDPHSELSAD